MKTTIIAILLSATSSFAQGATGYDALQNSQHRYAAEHAKNKNKSELNVTFTKVQEVQSAYVLSAKIERKVNGQLESSCTFADKKVAVESRLGEKGAYDNAKMNDSFPCGNDEASVGAVKYYTNTLSGSFIDVRVKTDEGEILYYHYTQGSTPNTLGPKN